MPADATAAEVAAANKEAIEAKTGKSYDTFNALEYGKQTVAGTNFFIKIDVGNDEAIVARIFKGFDGSYEVAGVQEGHTHDAEIKYF